MSNSSLLPIAKIQIGEHYNNGIFKFVIADIYARLDEVYVHLSNPTNPANYRKTWKLSTILNGIDSGIIAKEIIP